MYPSVTEYASYRNAAQQGIHTMHNASGSAVYKSIKDAVVRAIQAGEDHVYYHIGHRFPNDMLRDALRTVGYELHAKGFFVKNKRTVQSAGFYPDHTTSYIYMQWSLVEE